MNQNLALYELTKKSVVVAYIIGFLFGICGLHMLYLKDFWNFAARMGLFLASFVIPVLGTISLIVYLIDSVYTYFKVEEYNNKLKIAYGIPVVNV